MLLDMTWKQEDSQSTRGTVIFDARLYALNSNAKPAACDSVCVRPK